MRLADRPELIAELMALATSDQVDITSEVVKESAFYQAMQNTGFLDCFYSRLTPAALLLVAKIAATSPHLVTVDISYNYLGGDGPAIAAALAASCTLNKLNISYRVWSSRSCSSSRIT